MWMFVPEPVEIGLGGAGYGIECIGVTAAETIENQEQDRLGGGRRHWQILSSLAVIFSRSILVYLNTLPDILT
jgi:hypothetical protein